MKVEPWNNGISRGWEVALTIWRTRQHQWQLCLMRDRTHVTRNYLWRLELVRYSR